MAILSKATTTGPSRVALLVVLMLGLSLACHYISGDEVQGFGFDHRVHVEDEEMDCSDCHLGVEDSDEPGIPVLGQCQLCHDEESEAEKPEDVRIEALFEGNRYKTTGVFQLSDEVVFSHLQHVDSASDCADCHQGVDKSMHPSSLQPITMSDCMECHTQAAVANDCSTCHSEIDQDWSPPNHSQNWTRFHGPVSRSGRDDLSSRCDLCHKEQTCNDCHFTDPPENHNNYWRLRGHAVLARMDRMKCSTCHRSDFCERCHDEFEPLSHRGPWGGTRSNHCYSCHFPLRNNGCVTCHKSTPSHQTAPPRPPGHPPSLQCRSCHGVDVPLLHADKGDVCLICHQ
jgi:hypothetical protein